MQTFESVEFFLASLTADVQPNYKEHGETTERCWANGFLSAKQISWIRNTARFQRKAIPDELAEIYPELLSPITKPVPQASDMTHNETLPFSSLSANIASPATKPSENQVLADVLRDLAASLHRAADKLAGR